MAKNNGSTEKKAAPKKNLFSFDFICNSRACIVSVCWVIFRWWLRVFVFFFQQGHFFSCTRTSIVCKAHYRIFVCSTKRAQISSNSNSNQTDCELLAFLYCVVFGSFFFCVHALLWPRIVILSDEKPLYIWLVWANIPAIYVTKRADNCPFAFSMY